MPQAIAIDPRAQLFAPALGTAPGRGRLVGQKVLVLGAGQRDGPAGSPLGNGRAMCMLFAREGADVACVDRDMASAEETAKLARTIGARAIPICADAADPAFAQQVFAQAAAELGPLTAAVANVGIASGKTLANESAASWSEVMDVNVRAHMLLLQEGLVALPEGGAMLLISSLASTSPIGRNPAYETSKAALAALCRAAALEGQERGIRVNVIAPGLLDTPMGRAASSRSPTRTARPLPFRRQGTAWELAYTALFLISHESSYVNAQTLYMDGGLGSGVGLTPKEQ
jgi:NAD(P)-dependent dehydrogenase (short-subunit alcohol dehydrogenase family)